MYAAVLVSTARQAERAAKRLGFPVVLKVVSPDLLHKSDAGGVQVGWHEPGQVRPVADDRAGRQAPA